MNRILKLKYINIVLHTLIWSVLLLLPFLLSSPDQDYRIGVLPGFLFSATVLIHAALFYSNALFLFPKLFNRRWWWLYLPTAALLLMVSFWAKHYIVVTWFPDVLSDRRASRFVFAPSFGILIISIVYRRVIDRLRHEKEQKEKQAEQLTTELKFLRSQISPHFIFNVMTNMVALARQRSELLEPSLIKLSELLRYMLYETGRDKFRLEAEITYLKNYIALQQLRFGDDVSVTMEFRTAHADYLIEPMLLIPFVENAFKHGIGLVKDPQISVFLEAKDGRLLFRTVNKYNELDTAKDPASGIGLANIRKRLDLLYAGRHQLIIHAEQGIFSAELKLDLS